MTIIERMYADAKAAQLRQKTIWKIGSEYDDGKTVSVAEVQRPRPSEVTTHSFAWSKLELAYNPGFGLNI